MTTKPIKRKTHTNGFSGPNGNAEYEAIESVRSNVSHADAVQGTSPIDMEKLSTLGEMVWPGGGTEIVRLVEMVKAGRPFTYESLAGRLS